MRRIYSLALALFVCMASFAQITTVTYGGNEYEVTSSETLNLTEDANVAYAGHTADFSAQLSRMLAAVGLEAVSNDAIIQVDPTGAGFECHTNDGWHAADGTIQDKTWGSETKLMCVKVFNQDTQNVDGTLGYIGAIDNLWNPGEIHTCRFAAINENKAALLEVVITFVNAAYSASVTQYPTEDYSAGNAQYKMSDIATVLGTDAEGLAAALTDGTAVLGIFDAEGNLVASTADGAGSYWHKADGTITKWGNASAFYSGLNWTAPADDVMGIPLGQYPGYFKGGESVYAIHYIKYNDKVVALKSTLNVEKNLEFNDPVLYLSQLNIVKELNVALPFKLGKNNAQILTVAPSAEICDALECDEEALASNIEKVFLTQQLVVDESTSNASFTDSLLVSRWGTDGWFGRYSNYDEETGTETPILQNGPHTWGGGCTFYIQKPTIADGSFTLTYGQYGSLAVGDADYAELYIANGAKAIKLTLTVDVTEPETIDFSKMEKVGTAEYAGTLEVANQYTSVTIDIDAEAIKTALGCEFADMTHFNFANEEYNSIVDASDNDYWQSEEGFSLSWSNSPCCQVTLSLSNGTATLLQMAGKYIDITEKQTFPMHYILANGNNYYQLDFAFTLKPVGEITGELHCVSQESIYKQIVPANSYDVEGRYQIDMDYVESLIGTKDFNLYGDVYNSETGELEMTKNYTCYDTANKGFGFWYGSDTYTNSEGRNVVSNDGWNCASTNSFGFQIFTNGEIMFFQFPGVRQAGDAYEADMYLVNEETGAYITYTMNIEYVDTIIETEIVGEETVDITVPSLSLFDAPIVLDATKCYEALGLDAETIADATIYGYKSMTTTVPVESGEDMLINRQGYIQSNEDKQELAVSVSTEGGLSITVDPFDLAFEFGSGENVAVRFALDFEGKRYAYVVNLLSGKVELAEGLKAVTSLDELDGAQVVLMNAASGQYLYGKDAQNTAVADYATATDAANVVTGYKAEKVDNGYMFRCVTPAGSDYALWGKDVCYLNSQPNAGGVTFNLGKDQDVENGSTWALTWNNDYQAWAVKCIANNAYLAGTTVSEGLDNYWVIGTSEESTGINSILSTVKADGKFFQNNQIVIIRNGVKYNVAGAIIK